MGGGEGMAMAVAVAVVLEVWMLVWLVLELGTGKKELGGGGMLSRSRAWRVWKGREGVNGPRNLSPLRSLSLSY